MGIAILSDRSRLYVIILFTISILQYVHTINNSFVFDSEVVILQDQTITDFKYFPSYFTSASIKWEGDGEIIPMLQYYRPAQRVLYLLEYYFFGTNPVGYNIVNVFLNSLVVLMCYWFVLKVTGDAMTAFIASLLFAVNPSKTETVNNVYAASGILMTLFSLAALNLFCRGKHVFAVTAYSIALMSRETAVLLPVIIALYEYFPGKKRKLRDYCSVLPFLAIAGLYLFIRYLVVGNPNVSDTTLVPLINTIVVIVKRFVKIFFLPDAPITMYPAVLFRQINAEVIVSYSLLAILLLVGLLLWSKRREYVFWYLWFFVWISISFNVGKFGDFLISEKELYPSIMGFCVLFALLIVRVNLNKKAKIALIALVLSIHSYITVSRTFYWRDPVEYLEKLTEFVPDLAEAHYGLGLKYISKKMYDKALIELEKTINLRPKHSMAHNNSGNIHFFMKDYNKALYSWKKAIISDSNNSLPYYNIGIILEQRGVLHEALKYYRNFLSRAPSPSPEQIRIIANLEKRISG